MSLMNTQKLFELYKKLLLDNVCPLFQFKNYLSNAHGHLRIILIKPKP